MDQPSLSAAELADLQSVRGPGHLTIEQDPTFSSKLEALEAQGLIRRSKLSLFGGTEVWTLTPAGEAALKQSLQ